MRNVVLIVSLFLASCGGSATSPSTPAPPARSLDLTFARSLLDAQTAIQAATPLVATNPSIKAPLNQVIAIYNAAETAYLAYHQVVSAGGVADATALQAQIATLTSNVSALVTLFGGAPK